MLVYRNILCVWSKVQVFLRHCYASFFSFFFEKQTLPTGVLFSQMNCTGDATAERLSAQCYGNVAGRPVEVRIFRSSRPHNRLCCGLSLTHFHLSAQAKGCYSSSGQKELRANLTHSSVLLLTYLGVPIKSSLRLLLRPGPQRWALGIGLIVDTWRRDLNVALRLESPGLYGWHGLLEFGSRNVKHRGELTGRMMLESWCHIWADIIVAWDSITSSLLLSFRCKGLGRLAWVQVSRLDGGISHKTSLTIHGQAGKGGLKASLDLENEQDSCHCLMSALLRDQKAEVDWTLQHHLSYLHHPNQSGPPGFRSAQWHLLLWKCSGLFQHSLHSDQPDCCLGALLLLEGHASAKPDHHWCTRGAHCWHVDHG